MDRFVIFSFDEKPNLGNSCRWHFNFEGQLDRPYRTWNVVFLNHVITTKYALMFQNMIDRKFKNYKYNVPNIFTLREYAEEFLNKIPDDCKKISDEPRKLQAYTLYRYCKELEENAES